MPLAQPVRDEDINEVAMIMGTPEDESQTEPIQLRSSFPEPLSHIAYQGLVGEIVETIEPHTESDPVAILVQSLIVFGNIIGRKAHFRVEADRHYTNENAIIVGDTAKGRKGTSDGIVMSLFSLISHEPSRRWASENVKSGLSSGEGVIYHLRDSTNQDEGVMDKRLFIRESEFGGVLRTLERHGNTLSPVIRQAWDNGNLAILTRNNPIRATYAHVSISGHITAEELRRYLCDVDIFNGLANRFCWFCVKRSKLLPEGGRFHELNVTRLKEKILAAIVFSDQVDEVRRDEEAREIWINTYPDLSTGKPGMAGAVLSRAEAHVMRIALIYALMDKSTTIRRDHLLAALALWDYAESSVMYIFGDRTGDPVADRIYDVFGGRAEGATRSEICDVLGHHMTRERIDEAVSHLVRTKKATVTRERTQGRPIERIMFSHAR